SRRVGRRVEGRAATPDYHNQETEIHARQDAVDGGRDESLGEGEAARRWLLSGALGDVDLDLGESVLGEVGRRHFAGPPRAGEGPGSDVVRWGGAHRQSYDTRLAGAAGAALRLGEDPWHRNQPAVHLNLSERDPASLPADGDAVAQSGRGRMRRGVAEPLSG